MFALLIVALVTIGERIIPHPDYTPRAVAAARSNLPIYLPFIAAQKSNIVATARRINVPYFAGTIPFPQTAIAWFGRVTPTENYVDARLGYNDTELYIYVDALDRRLWYNPTPGTNALTAWDSVTIYLNRDGNTGTAPSANAFRLDAQLNDGQLPRTPWQASYHGTGTSWATANLSFTTTSGYRWFDNTHGGVNNDQDNKGWAITFHIPFTSLGLTTPPAAQTTWGIALALHDRDDAAGTPIADKLYPENFSATAPVTWAQLNFGLPTFTPPIAIPGGTIKIQNKLNGAIVKDSAVGGYSNCGTGLDIWNQWGNANYNGYTDFNIQNQSDVADFPCFSKYYITFPLDALPTNKAIISATLTLHQQGNSDPSQAQPSLIQVFTVNEDWDPATLTWNNAPLPAENMSRAWVDPIQQGCSNTSTPPWPCTPRIIDVSRAVANAYTAGKPLRLALYSADSDYHSGKYFTSSSTGDWNAAGRPTLDVLWGNP